MNTNNGKRILIVDDDDNMRHSIMRLLTLENKYDIQEAHDGSEVEKATYAFHPDLIILDIKMPHMSGYDVCLQLERNHTTAKILAVSGQTGGIGGAIIEALGAHYYFEKPFDTERFKKKVAELTASNN